MGGTSPSDPVLASRLATSNAPPSFCACSFSFAPLLTRHRSPLGSCPVLLALLPASLLHLLSFARDGYLPLHLPPESPPPSPHWHSSPSHPRCRATTDDDDDILHPRSPSTSARRASMPSPSSAPRSASSTRPVSCARGTHARAPRTRGRVVQVRASIYLPIGLASTGRSSPTRRAVMCVRSWTVMPCVGL